MQSTVTILSVSILSTEWPYNYSIALSLNNGHSQLCVVLKTIFYLLAKQLIESIFLCDPHAVITKLKVTPTSKYITRFAVRR